MADEDMTISFRVIRLAAIVPLMAACASCATMAAQRDDSAEFAKEIEGKVAEKARTCIPLADARGAKAFDDALVYRVSRRLTYVNKASGCNAFDPDPIFVTDVRGGQLCRGDVVQLVSRVGGIAGPVCILGDFTPYRSPR